MTDFRLKDAIKLDIVMLDKSEKYPEENLYSKDGLYRYLHQPGEQHEHQNRRTVEYLYLYDRSNCIQAR